MKKTSGAKAGVPPSGQPGKRRFLGWPSTRPGWWSVGLGAVYVVLSIINAAVFMRMTVEVSWGRALLPFYGIFMLLCGLAAGILALIAVIRQHERSWLVWITLLPGLFVLFLLLGEFLVPH